MNKKLKAIVTTLNPEQRERFGELYTAIMDATGTQAKAILVELETVEGLPVEAVDFLKHQARVTVGDHSYLSES